MNFKPFILPAVNAFLWGAIAWVGFEGEKGVEARVGSVSLGQVEWYVAFPLIMVSVSVIPALLLRQTKWAGSGTAWLIFTLLLILPYGCLYGGGM